VIKSRGIGQESDVEQAGESRESCRVLVRKRERERPLGRPRRRW